MKSFKLNLVGMILAAVHLTGCLLTLLVIKVSEPGQTAMVWGLWVFVDLPWSFLIYQLIDQFSLAVIVHVSVGTVWWYSIPVLTSSIRSRNKGKPVVVSQGGDATSTSEKN